MSAKAKRLRKKASAPSGAERPVLLPVLCCCALIGETEGSVRKA